MGRSGAVCGLCVDLSRHPVVQGILDRMNEGTQKGTTFAYLGFNDLVRSLNHKTDQNDFLHLNSLNQTQTILRRTSMLPDYKWLVVAISSRSVARVDRVIHVALKQKRGIVAALEQVKAAAKGVYKVKSFMEQERMVATLMWRLGGDRVGHIAHRALGLPSVGALRNGSVKTPIMPSAGTPTIGTIGRNTRSVLSNILPLLKDMVGDVVHAVVMVDELATEKHIRYYPHTNEFLGLCRRHGPAVSLQFKNIGDLDEVFRALDMGEVHYASEVGVDICLYAASIFADSSRVGDGWCSWDSMCRQPDILCTDSLHIW